VGLLVPLVAVPLLIARGGSEGTARPIGFGTASSQSSPETKNAVVAYRPGIRNFKKRLSHLGAKDPFTQQYVTPPASSSTSSTTSADDLAQILNGSSTGGSTGVGGGSTGSGGSGGSTKPVKVTHHITYFWW
jgi:hypothetical protein